MKTKIRFWIPAIMLVSSLFLVTNCTKEATIPLITTNEVTEITQTTATSGGNVTSEGGATVTARGVCWSTNQNPTIDDSKTIDSTVMGSFTSTIKSLTANTTYYVRAYATNSKGTGYGSAMSFTTQEENIPVSDLDGNVYNTVSIGTQTWMAENLKVTTYNDGTSIPNVTDATEWSQLHETGALCDYENTPSYSETYGKLYNWYAVNTGKLCPTGWHVPTDAEWTTLINYLGGDDVAGGKLKETGIMHWGWGNNGATNETGFTALPSGYREFAGTFYSLTDYGCWWSATERSAATAWHRSVSRSHTMVGSEGNIKETGLSIRCVRD